MKLLYEQRQLPIFQNRMYDSAEVLYITQHSSLN